MSVFNKKEDADQEPVGKKAAEPTAGKGRPTPKRKDAQAQNLRPLVPKDREASRKAAKARMRERENAEYDAMQKGDINHMPKSERLPWRIYIRDYVDARFNLGEFFIPVAFVILIGSIFVTYKWPALALPLMLLMYIYLFAVIIDIVIMWRKLKKKLIEKVRRAVRGQGHAFPVPTRGAVPSRCVAGVCRSRAIRSVDTGPSDPFCENRSCFFKPSAKTDGFSITM